MDLEISLEVVYKVAKNTNSGISCLGLNPSSVTYCLCDFGQIIQLLCT